MKMLFVVFVFIAGSVQAQIPRTLSYQGVLTDANGEAITTSGIRLTFQIHTEANNGAILWKEIHDSVPVDNGVFSVIESTTGGFKFPDGTRQTTAVTASPWQATSSKNDIFYSAGNVGIGTDSPSNILTLPKGTATDPIADAWTTYSSRRWKTNIKTIDKPLQKVQRLRGVAYDWKASGKHDIGLIAEEVGAVIPEVVVYEANGVDAKSVDYPRLVAVLIEAVKAQQEEITQLRQNQQKLHELTSRLDALQKLVARISNGETSVRATATGDE